MSGRGRQKLTAPAKFTHVTERFYLQDAVFVAAIGGPVEILAGLRDALRSPAFPLALGRRACVPTQPMLWPPDVEDEHPDRPGMWIGDPTAVLSRVEWLASAERIRQLRHTKMPPAAVDLSVTVDDPDGEDVLMDLPTTFDPKTRSFSARRVHHTWVRVPTPFRDSQAPDTHDPFALLGW